MTDSLTPFVVRQHDSLEAAMLVIEGNRHHSVVVVDDENVVVGTLSDGDVRKAILDRRLLTTPVEAVMNTNFVALGPDDRDRAREYFERDRDYLFLVPIVDGDGTLLEIQTAY